MLTSLFGWFQTGDYATFKFPPRGLHDHSSQPLHAGLKSDKGANTYQIRVGDRGTNLHGFWDSGLVFETTHSRSNEDAIARLSAELDRNAPARRPVPSLQPEAWIAQSCSVAHSQGFYPDPNVSPEYIAWADRTMQQQLILGSDELAGVLNHALVGIDPMTPSR